MKSFTTEELDKKFDRMSAIRKVAVLYAALDEMQHYNGQNVSTTIYKGMGYEPVTCNGYDGKWKQGEA